jgi:hypothetical protein
MRALLIVVSVALTLLVSGPVLAQTAADDQYGSSGLGHDAATDALRASRAFDGAPDTEAADVEEGAAFAAELAIASADPEAASAGESGERVSQVEPKIDSLPDTGGTSPLLLGVLLVAGGALLRALTR